MWWVVVVAGGQGDGGKLSSAFFENFSACCLQGYLTGCDPRAMAELCWCCVLSRTPRVCPQSWWVPLYSMLCLCSPRCECISDTTLPSMPLGAAMLWSPWLALQAPALRVAVSSSPHLSPISSSITCEVMVYQGEPEEEHRIWSTQLGYSCKCWCRSSLCFLAFPATVHVAVSLACLILHCSNLFVVVTSMLLVL